MAKFVLVEASPYRVSDGASVDLRFAGGGRAARPYNHRGFNDWRSGIASVPNFSAGFVYGEKGWTGGALPQVAPIVLSLTSKDTLADIVDDYLWIGAPIAVRTGDDDLATPVYVLEMTGTVASVTVRDGAMTITVTDLSGKLDEPLTTATFAGTGGLEGIIEAEGRAKRRTWGKVRNVEGFVLDKATNVFEFGDPNFGVASFDTVSDIGRSGPLTTLAWQGTALATLNALKAATPPAGGGVVAASICCVKWWTQPVGPLTADMTGDVGAGSTKVADVAARIIATAVTAGPAFESTSFAAALAARTAPTGIHVEDSSETVASALDRLLIPMSILWFVDSGGLIRLALVDYASPVETIAGQSFERAETFRPAKSVKVGYRKNYREHNDSELSAAILTTDITGLGGLATLNNVKFGTGPTPQIMRGDGTTPATEADFLTSAGVAAGFIGQQDLATTQRSSLLAGDNNRIRYSLMESGAAGYALADASASSISALNVGVSSGKNYVSVSASFTANNQELSLATAAATVGDRFPVNPSERLYIAAKIGSSMPSSLCMVRLLVYFYDSTGVAVGAAAVFTGYGSDGFPTLRGGFADAPYNAVSAGLRLNAQNGATGVTGGFSLYLSEPMATSAGATQTIAPLFTPGPGTELGADVTSAITGPTLILIPADYLGAIDSAQFPKSATFKLFRNGVQVTSGVAWTLSLISGSLSMSMNTVNSEGILSITGLVNDSVIRTTAVYGSTTRVFDVAVRKDKAAPPVGGTGGSGNPGTTASTGGIASTSSASYTTAKAGPLTCKAGTGGTITASLSATFDRTTGGSSGCFAKVQWRVVGGTWADVASEASSQANAVGGSSPESGSIDYSIAKTGLTSGTDYEFQLLLRGSTATTLAFTGTFTITGT